MAVLERIVAFYRLLMILLICSAMIPVALFFFALGKDADWGFTHLRRIWSGSILAACFIRRRVEGLENLEGYTPCIFLSNHKSEWDWYMFTHYIPVTWRATIKAELKDFFIGGPMSEKTGQVFISKEGGVDELIEKCRPHIKAGRSILMYPEGRRTRSESLDEFKAGSFYLAARTGLPVIPVAIRETHWATRPGLFNRKYGHFCGPVTLRVGAPIFPNGSDRASVDRLLRSSHTAMVKLIVS